MKLKGAILIVAAYIIGVVSCQPTPINTLRASGEVAEQKSPLPLTVQATWTATPITTEKVMVESLPITRAAPTLPATQEVVREEQVIEAGNISEELMNTHLEALTPEGGIFAFNPVWSKDGQNLAYRKESSAIWIVNTNSWDNPQEILSVSRIWELADTHSVLTSYNMAWSPDDKALAITLWYPGNHTGGIAIYDLIQDEANLVYYDIGAVYDWNEKGLLACRFLEGCFLLDGNFNHEERIGDMSSSLFLNNEEIVYVQEDSSVAIKNLETGQEEIIPNLTMRQTRSGQYAMPVPSPDGRFIASVHDRAVLPKIEIYDRDSEQLIEIPAIRGVEVWSSVSWSPDSRRLAFVSDGTIWILSLNV